MITAKDEREAKKLAMKFIEHFIDDDENPDKIADGYTFYNNEIIRPTLRDQGNDKGSIQGIPLEDSYHQPGLSLPSVRDRNAPGYG